MTVLRFAPAAARRTLAVLSLLVVVSTTASCASSSGATGGLGAGGAAAGTRSAAASTAKAGTAKAGTANASTASRAAKAPAISLGRGFLHFPDAAQAWVAAHPNDRRTAAIKARIASQPTNLWLTGNESFGNLRQAVALGRARNRTLLLTLWNIPLRYDGLSKPRRLSLAAYKKWVNRVARIIGKTRAVVVLEPDALWFYDRLPSAAARATRIAALRYAVTRLHTVAPRTRVYLEAGTSSGSVTAARMATLLLRAGLADAAGYAVNVSSYAPAAAIRTYAQQIRRSLQKHHLANPRYVVDTGRNGASTWDNTWCNPTQQRLGPTPRLVRSTNGLDMDLWVKAPGTSDGDCGPAGGGAGSYGGEFLPTVAARMITG